MQYLAIDTTSDIMQLAMFNSKTKKKVSAFKKTETTQTAELHPLLKDFLDSNNVKVKDIDTIIVNLGPGSYTSLRIGLATAKGLSLPFDTKVIGVNSFDLYSYLYAKNDSDPAILIKNTAKTAYLRIGGENSVEKVEDLKDKIPENAKIYGDGADKYADYINKDNIVKGSNSFTALDMIDFVLETNHQNNKLELLYIKKLNYIKSGVKK